MKKYISLTIICLIILILNCEIDHGLRPLSYKIKGKVIFSPGNPPPNTDRVEVFALKEFPPQNPQNFLYLSRSGPIDFTQREADYEILVSKTSYQLIGVVWKEKDQDWNLTGLMGIYTGGLNSILPDSVVITDDSTVVEDVDIPAIWQRVAKDNTISGNIYYEGEWPEDTQLLLLAVYSIKPDPSNEFSYFSFDNLDYTQPLFVESSSYRLNVNSNVYNYIVLFWVGKTIKKLSDLIEIGVYKNPNNLVNPYTVDLSDGEEATDIDIYVNFNELQLN